MQVEAMLVRGVGRIAIWQARQPGTAMLANRMQSWRRHTRRITMRTQIERKMAEFKAE